MENVNGGIYKSRERDVTCDTPLIQGFGDLTTGKQR